MGEDGGEMYKLLSHVFEGRKSRNQTLHNHLKGVTEIALETTRMHGVIGEIEQVIETICMCHDFGKASSYFQAYLSGEYNKELKNHAEISAYFTYYMLPEEWKLIGFMVVKKHHGDMNPDKDFFNTRKKEVLIEIAENIEKNIGELECIYERDLSGFFEEIKDGTLIKKVHMAFLFERRKKIKTLTDNDLLREYIWVQYLWSLLLTADKTQLIRGQAYINKKTVKEEIVSKYKNSIREDLLKKLPEIKNSELFKIRNTIYDETIESINSIDLVTDRILSINVPTGTGKTIAVYGGAFRLFERIVCESNGQVVPSIIYNIPFTSVIDQNYNVLKNIIMDEKNNTFEDLILKHHSLSEIEYKEDEGCEYKNYDARFLVENWQSTIITTTFVQLFNTLFRPGKNSIEHRFHKLAGSIIILDEVQTIPPKYYKIIENIFSILTKEFNTYIITVTATRPLFLEGKELINSREKIFQSLNRITLINNTTTPMYLNEFYNILKEDIIENTNKSFLIVMNTVKSSMKIFDWLQNEDMNRKIIYLSTEIYPRRRLEIIEQIKKNNKKYVLVSTQLIEAGVDIDFDIVYRDMSTIDSINQTAGRVNRNAIKEKGIVKIFSLMNEEHNDKKFSRYIYSGVLLDITEDILKDKNIINENEIDRINHEYFSKVRTFTEKKCNEDYNEILEAIKKFDYQKVRKLFKLIDDDYEKTDIIVNIDEETQKRLEVIQCGDGSYQEIMNAWRYLNGFRISVNKKDMDNINSYDIKGVQIINKDDYDICRGVKRNNIVIF